MLHSCDVKAKGPPPKKANAKAGMEREPKAEGPPPKKAKANAEPAAGKATQTPEPSGNTPSKAGDLETNLPRRRNSKVMYRPADTFLSTQVC